MLNKHAKFQQTRRQYIFLCRKKTYQQILQYKYKWNHFNLSDKLELKRQYVNRGLIFRKAMTKEDIDDFITIQMSWLYREYKANKLSPFKKNTKKQQKFIFWPEDSIYYKQQFERIQKKKQYIQLEDEIIQKGEDEQLQHQQQQQEESSEFQLKNAHDNIQPRITRSYKSGRMHFMKKPEQTRLCRYKKTKKIYKGTKIIPEIKNKFQFKKRLLNCSKKPFIKSPMQRPNEKKIFNQLIKQFQLKQNLTYSFSNFIAQYCHPLEFPELLNQDCKIISLYERKQLAFPIKIQKTKEKGVGIHASRDIKRGELICVYSGYIVSLGDLQIILQQENNIYLEKCVLGLDSNLSIVPYKIGNFGHLLNHAFDNWANCQMKLVTYYKKPLALMIAKKRIKEGDPIEWNYNSGHNDEIKLGRKYQTIDWIPLPHQKIQIIKKTKLIHKKKKKVQQKNMNIKKIYGINKPIIGKRKHRRTCLELKLIQKTGRIYRNKIRRQKRLQQKIKKQADQKQQRQKYRMKWADTYYRRNYVPKKKRKFHAAPKRKYTVKFQPEPLRERRLLRQHRWKLSNNLAKSNQRSLKYIIKVHNRKDSQESKGDCSVLDPDQRYRKHFEEQSESDWRVQELSNVFPLNHEPDGFFQSTKANADEPILSIKTL